MKTTHQLIYLVLVLAVAVWPVHAATDRVWTGGAGNGLWSSPNNWSPVGALQDNDSIRFPSSFNGRVRTTNDLVNLMLNSIWVEGWAPAFVVWMQGNDFRLSGGIAVDDNAQLFVSQQITLSADQDVSSGDSSVVSLPEVGLNGYNLVARPGLDILPQFPAMRLHVLGTGNVTNRSSGGKLQFSADDTFVGSLVGGGLLLGHFPAGGTLILHNASSVVVERGASIEGAVVLNGRADISTELDLPPFTSHVLSGPISGSGDLYLSGEGTFVISGNLDNTWNGTTYSSCNLLVLNKTGGARALSGPLVIGKDFGPPRTNEVLWLGDHQMAVADVSVRPESLMNLNNFSQEISALNLAGGDVATGSGELTVNGPVLHNTSLETSKVDGNLRLSSGYHDFYAFDAILLNPEVIVTASIRGPGHLRKTGAGTLRLGGNNSYTGLTLIEEGIVAVTSTSALGTVDSETIVNDGATLWLDFGAGTVNEGLNLRGAGYGGTNGALRVGGSISLRNQLPTIYSCLDFTSDTVIRVDPGARLTTDGFISGAGPLTKIGQGILLFTNTNPNIYSGDTLILDGTLVLGKPDNTLAVPGNLVVGPAPLGSSAQVRWLQNGGLNQNSNLTVNAGAVLDLNDHGQNLRRLTLNDGGRLQTGTGQLNLAPGAIVQVGSLSPSGSHASASISGKIGLPANNFVTFQVAPYAIFPPFAMGAELEVPALIGVNGVEVDLLEPAGFTKTALGRMRLSGTNTYKGDAFISGGTLQVDGPQPQSFVRVGAGARFEGFGIVGPVNFQGNSGVVAPGASPGVLTTGNFNPGATGHGILQAELNGTTAGSGYDQLDVRGSLTLTGTALQGSLKFPSTVSDQFTIIANDGSDAVVGTFNGLPEGASFYIGSEEFTISYTGGTGNDVVLTRIPTRPLPVLTIEPVLPSLVRLLWPTNDPAFRLQSATNLTATDWVSVLPLPVIIGTNYVVTNATSGTETVSAVSPLAWYRLGENDPDAANGLPVTSPTADSAGMNPLQPFGSPGYTSAVSPDASAQVASDLGVQLNGNGQYLSNATVTTVVDGFGIEAWVRPDAVSSTYQFVAYNGNTASNGWGIAWQDGLFQGWFGNVILFGAGAVTPGTWAHVALVRDGGSSTLYVNGIPASSPTAFSPKTPTTGFALGVRPQMPVAEFFNGAIDEVRVFTFAPGQFRTNDLLLHRVSTVRGVESVKFYRLIKP